VNPMQASPSLQSAFTTTATELLFLDPGVADYAQLLPWVRSSVEIHILHPAQEPIAQIALAVAHRPSLRRIHLVSHGSPGQLHFAAGVVGVQSLDRFAAVRSALANTQVELVLYGCRVGAGAIGQAFVAALAESLGCGVVAASEPIGHVSHGGGWNLDVVAGTVGIESLAFDSGVVAYEGHFAPGSVDVTFGDGRDGQTVTDVSGTTFVSGGLTYQYDDTILQTIVMSNGKIVVFSELSDPSAVVGALGQKVGYAITRYNADGTLDTTFDGDGRTIINSLDIVDPSTSSSATYQLRQPPISNPAFLTFNLAKIEVLADGSIVTAGTIRNPTLPLGTPATAPSGGTIADKTDQDFIVLKYTNSGGLDSTFGDFTAGTAGVKRGFAITNFNTYNPSTSPQSNVESQELALRDFSIQNGKIVLLGQSEVYLSLDRGTKNRDLAVLRYNSNGSLDTAFSSDGKDSLDFSVPSAAIRVTDNTNQALGQSPNSIISLADGSTIVVRQSPTSSDNQPESAELLLGFAKYAADGTLVAAFKGDSNTNYYPSGVPAQNQPVPADPFLLKQELLANAVKAIEVKDGYIYLFGNINSVAPNSLPTSAITQNLYVARLNVTTGAVDTSFGSLGATDPNKQLVKRTILDVNPLSYIANDFAGIGGGNDVYAGHVFLPDGKILVLSSSSSNGADRRSDFVLTRLSSTGILDITFGTAGFTRTNITRYTPVTAPSETLGNSDDQILGYKLLGADNRLATATNPATKILIYGSTTQDVKGLDVSSISLARYNLSDGKLDITFGAGLPPPSLVLLPTDQAGVVPYVLASPQAGIVVTDILKQSLSDYTFVDVDDRGRIIIAGTLETYSVSATAATLNGTDIAVMRLLSNGNADTRFSPSGQIIYDVASNRKLTDRTTVSTSLNNDDVLVGVSRQLGDLNKLVLIGQTSRPGAASSLDQDLEISLVRIGNNVPFFKDDAAIRQKLNPIDAEGVGIYEITRSKKPGTDLNFIDGTTNLFKALVNDFDPEDFVVNPTATANLEIKILALRRKPGTGTDPVPATLQLIVRTTTDPTSSIVRVIAPGETGTVNFTELDRLFLTSPVGVTGTFEFDWVVSDGEDDSRRPSLAYPNGQPVAQALIQIDNRPPRFTTGFVSLADQLNNNLTSPAVTGPLSTSISQNQSITLYPALSPLRVNIYDPDADDLVTLSAPTISTLVSTNGAAGVVQALAALPSWLGFGLVTAGQTKQYEYRTITAPTNADVGVYTVTLLATDSNNKTNLDVYTGGTYPAPQAYVLNLTIANVNDAPTIGLTPGQPPQSTPPDPDGSIVALEDSLFNLSFTGADIDLALNRYGIKVDPNEKLTFSITNQPSWLTFTPAANGLVATLSGTPTNDNVGRYDNLKITVTDNGGKQAFLDFKIRVQNTNDIPILSTPLLDQPAIPWGQVLSYVVLPNTFTDIDVGDVLRYSAQIVDGATISALPSWLTFNPATQTFSGEAPPSLFSPGITDQSRTITVRVTASDRPAGDPELLFKSDDFTFTFTNKAPTRILDILDQETNLRAAFSLPVPTGLFSDTDPGDTNLTYSASLVGGGVLPAWLSFNPTTKTFTKAANAGTLTLGTPLSIRLTATDRTGASVFDDFKLTVINTNLAPEVLSPIEDQNATIGQAFNFTIPGSAFKDPDALLGDPALVYTFTSVVDPTLDVSWLTPVLTAGVLTGFTGTPPITPPVGKDVVGTIKLQIKATDKDGGISILPNEFSIVVDPVFPGVSFGGTNTIADLLGRDIIGTAGNETLNGGIYNDRLRGLDGVDTLNGNSGDDLLEGGGGGDTLNGGRGNDFLRGEAGIDILNGGSGNDILIGGADNDTLTGGTGRDKFVRYSQTEGVDTITDFTAGQDLIDLRVMFARSDFSNNRTFSALSFVANGSGGVSIRVNSNTVTNIVLFNVDNVALSVFNNVPTNFTLI
jgi:uncharacterized delta-60 repeat protein